MPRKSKKTCKMCDVVLTQENSYYPKVSMRKVGKMREIYCKIKSKYGII